MTKRIARTDRESSSLISLSDLELEGMFFASTVRSPISRGILKSIEPPTFPRGYSMIQSNDIPGDNSILSFGTTIPILSSDRISYRGEPLALVTGPDHALADELASRVKVLFEEEPPDSQLGDFLIGASSRQTRRDDRRSGHCLRQGCPHRHGSLQDRSRRALLQRTDGRPGPQRLRQDGSVLRDPVAIPCARLCRQCALVEEDEVVVRPTMLGVHLDGKLWYPSLVSCHAAVASMRCGHPVKILYTREEDFLYTPKRARSSVSISSATDPSGAITALNIHLSVNVGAHAPMAEEF